MSKSTKITLIFILIFVIGVLAFVAHINHTLNNPGFSTYKDTEEDPYLLSSHN